MYTKKRIILSSFLFLFFLLLSGGVFFFYHNQTAQGATVTWTGAGGNALWSNGANWSSGTKPAPGDIAYFNNTCATYANCDVTINETVTLTGLTMTSAYTGTITHTTHTITINGTWTQEGGTFAGGSGNITVKYFVLAGGDFQSTNGILTLGEEVTPYNSSILNTNVKIFYATGGSFDSRVGTVKFTSKSNTGICSGVYIAFVTNIDITFNNVTLDMGYYGCGSVVSNRIALYLSGSGNVRVDSDMTIFAGRLAEGVWKLSGNLIDGGGNMSHDNSKNTGTIQFIGSSNQTYSSTGDVKYPVLSVDKPSGTVDPVSGSSQVTVYSLRLINGKFTAPSSGTLSIMNNLQATSLTSLYIESGGEYVHNGGTLNFYENNYNGPCTPKVHTIDTVNTLSLYNLYVNQYLYRQCGLSINGNTPISNTGGGVTITNRLQINQGTLQGSWNVEGDVVIGTGAYIGYLSGNGAIHFTGSGDQTYTDLGGDEPDGDIYINKEDGFVLANSNVDWNASVQALYLQKGKFIVGSNYSVYLNGLSISQGGEFNMIGTGDLILSSNAINNGKFIARARGACGGSDSIFIRSNSTGVQRAWSGNGSFVIQDAEIRDMSGTAPITVYSSTNSGNNGSNWTFSSDPCPEAPVSAEIRGGLISIPNGLVEIQ